jgi:hypothetical protein
MKKAFSLATLATLALPLVSFAAINDIKGVGQFIIDTINGVFVPVLFSLAFIVFIWGAFNTFILGATSEDVKEKGKSLMLYGLIGFFVMLSVWGLVGILTRTADLGDNTLPDLPSGGSIQ